MEKLLIVIDMQKDFVTGVLGSKAAQEVVPGIAALAEEYHTGGNPILFTMDTHPESLYDGKETATQEASRIPRHCVSGTDGWQIVPQLQPYVGDNLVEKPDFLSLNLEDYVPEELGGATIELCGVCTDICVVSNALYLRARFPYAKIVVRERLCAATTPENHQAALSVMKSCLIDVE